jgi:methanethiol S-methyltransferase
MKWYIADTVLVLLFAAQHSLGTTSWAKTLISRLMYGRTHLWNAAYNVGTFAVLAFAIKCWSTSTALVWAVPAPWSYLLTAFAVLLVVSFFYLFKFTQPFGEWLGYAQVTRMARGLPHPAGEGYRIKRHGIKRYIRFPHHTVLILLFWCWPTMRADLFLLAVEATIYLWLGSVHQDMRGTKYFPDQWPEYQRNSRLLFPAIEHVFADLRLIRRSEQEAGQ